MDILLNTIIQDTELHRRWLATLSYLELCGARKIASFLPKNLHSGVHSTHYELELLQHASEEFRHAYYFHKQIAKLESSHAPVKFCKRYSSRYLHLLDLRIARLLRSKDYNEINKGCYVLTTYAIEKRAMELYGVYESLLKSHSSPVSVRSILAEENGHLRQIEEVIAQDVVLQASAEEARNFEYEIFKEFWKELEDEIAFIRGRDLTNKTGSQGIIHTKLWTENDKIYSSTCA